MAKYHYPPPQTVPVQTNATTASPNLVRAITLNPTYEAKTAQVVLTRDQGTLRLSVYRASASPSALGMFSRDDFERTPAGLKSIRKADVKYLPPAIPGGAVRKVIDGIEVFTMTEMTDEEERLLRDDLAAILGR
ncbi:MAG TPA: hypothetical protein VFP15_06010 [Gemmatimonadaceae bacterium]|nr:hypothetical protein [Gemmatimonadaceae bacterium]